MRILLDTNGYSAFQRHEKSVIQIIEKANGIFVPWILLGEIYFGSFDGNKTQENINILQEFLAIDRISVLYPDEKTNVVYGEIAAELKRLGKPIQQNDIWIASVAKQHNLPLLTRDQAFTNILGLHLINW